MLDMATQDISEHPYFKFEFVCFELGVLQSYLTVVNISIKSYPADESSYFAPVWETSWDSE